MPHLFETTHQIENKSIHLEPRLGRTEGQDERRAR